MKRKTVFSDCRGGHPGGLPFFAKKAPEPNWIPAPFGADARI